MVWTSAVTDHLFHPLGYVAISVGEVVFIRFTSPFISATGSVPEKLIFFSCQVNVHFSPATVSFTPRYDSNLSESASGTGIVALFSPVGDVVLLVEPGAFPYLPILLSLPVFPT